MFGLRSDMSGIGQICLVCGSDMSGHQKLHSMEKYIGSQDDASRSR
jgi:hypothetical protein